ncbi:hypothetical protein CY34DRAFT_335496 [Suillus luteus UH-Slu-Lm8-n1]|uniref:DUF6533 domain-containing protein n=1 Tax=Suillus luteus UH-Slu-Lm8-n1 TaxID=930992 RepID=A0A0C9ZP59_9AGAM|nr:hypothetical protein CY34DRAFT_335496 [Suillus luteus UH-Slu-Lm8-n1]
MGDYVPDSNGLQTVAYVEVASTAALLFDFCITFGSEVRWTWGRKWGIVRIAFVISRYLPVASFAMSVYYAIESTRGGILNYWKLSAAYGVIHFVGAVAAEVLLVTRIYVLWGGKKNFLIAISGFSMVMNAAMLAISMLDAGKSTDSTRGVFEEGQNASIIYGLLTFYELVLVSLTLYKRFKCHRLESSPLIANLYRHGVIYLLCITVASMANCVAIAALPASYTALLIGWLYTVFLPRVSCSIYEHCKNRRMSL